MNVHGSWSALIIPVIVLLAAVAMMVVETLRAGRKWPNVPGWWFRAFLLNGAQVGAVWLAALDGTAGCSGTGHGMPTL